MDKRIVKFRRNAIIGLIVFSFIAVAFIFHFRSNMPLHEIQFGSPQRDSPTIIII